MVHAVGRTASTGVDVSHESCFGEYNIGDVTVAEAATKTSSPGMVYAGRAGSAHQSPVDSSPSCVFKHGDGEESRLTVGHQDGSDCGDDSAHGGRVV